MNKGWVKYYRSIEDHELLANDNAAFIVFMKLLIKVDRKTGKYITGRFKLSELTNLAPSTAWGALKRLEKSKMVDIKADNKKSTISICNWAKWQDTADTLPDNKPTTNEQQTDTKQEVISKKKEYKTITNVIGEPVYGNADINLIVDVFEKAVGKQPRATKQRRAAQTLKQRHGVDRVLKAIEFYTQVRGTPYSPNISTLEDLRDKWVNLETFAGKKLSSQPKGIIQI